ncbi:MAG TPA: ATP-grasp domain-containing protein [Acidimicrobiia bacterium]|nr:ATP-grasp domain-containing protein [Acidimicrobiia bacterium]
MARVLLLLPTGTYKAPDFLDAARRLDVDVVVASETAQTLADAMGDRALVVDLADPEASAAAINALAARHPLDAVVGVDDQGVMIAALAGERLGLSHNAPEAVARTRNKAAMRTALAATAPDGGTADAAGILRQPAFRVVGRGGDVVAAAEAVGWPVVVKPVSLSASRGVIRADDPAAAEAAAARVWAILDDDCHPGEEPILVEAYVPGEEVAVEGLLRAGRLEVLAVFDKPDPLTGPYFEETIYVTPSRLPEPIQADIARSVAGAAAAIGLTEGPVHAELRIDPDGRPWILELAARTIGGLCARTLRFAAGVTLEELVLRHALGLPVDPRRETVAAGVMMLPSPRPGRLVAVHGQDEARAVPGITALDLSIPPGGDVRPLPEGDRYLGFLFARAPTPAEVEQALRRAHAYLNVEIAPPDLP